MNNYRIQKMPNCLILILNVMVSRKSEDAGVYRCGGRLRALNCWTQASEVKVTHPGSSLHFHRGGKEPGVDLARWSRGWVRVIRSGSHMYI